MADVFKDLLKFSQRISSELSSIEKEAEDMKKEALNGKNFKEHNTKKIMPLTIIHKEEETAKYMNENKGVEYLLERLRKL